MEVSFSLGASASAAGFADTGGGKEGACSILRGTFFAKQTHEWLFARRLAPAPSRKNGGFFFFFFLLRDVWHRHPRGKMKVHCRLHSFFFFFNCISSCLRARSLYIHPVYLPFFLGVYLYMIFFWGVYIGRGSIYTPPTRENVHVHCVAWGLEPVLASKWTN